MPLPSPVQSVLDLSFSLFFVGPLTVLFWRGTFNTVSNMAFTDENTFHTRWYPALLLYLTGLLVKISVDLIKQSLKSIMANRCILIKELSTFIVIYLDATFGVVMWVGGFNLLYVFPSLYWFSLTGVLILSTSILMFIQGFHCTGGTPLSIYTDDLENVFTPTTYFDTTIDSSGYAKVVLDTIISYAVVHSLVICTWWGMWELENRYILFPCEITVKDIQAWDSVVLAYLFVFLVVALDKSLKEMEEEGEGNLKLRVSANCVAFLAFLASLNFWRGIWSLQDFYFFPNMNLKENLVLSHILGFLGTFLSRTSLTLTQSSAKDPRTGFNFFACRYWNGREICGGRHGYQDLDQEPL